MRSRPLAILICVVILITSVFVVTSSAAGTENLIEPDLTQWEVIDYDDVDLFNKSDIYRITVPANSAGYSMGIIYDLPSFVAGHSYTFKFSLPSASDISAAWSYEYTTDNIVSHYNNSTVRIGYGYLNSQGIAITNEVVLFEFNSTNISKYVGKNLTTSFVAGSAEGSPVVFISVSNTDGKQHRYFFSDFYLIDNDDNSGEIKGIMGILHSLRWDIVGGVCDNEDCAHSTEFNPHLSLTERFTAGFSNLFDLIASKFEEGSTLNTWFSGLSDGVTKLGTNVNGWLSGLGNSIISKLSNVLSGITSGLSDLGIDVGGFIDGAVSAIDKLFGSLFDWIETFKPRVYERFKWRPGDINESTGQVVLKEEGYPYAVVTDFYTVEPGSKAYLNFSDTSEFPEVAWLGVYQYDYYGNYVCLKLSTNMPKEDYELPSGFSYRFKVLYSSSDVELGDINKYVGVYVDEGWIMSYIHKFEDFFTGIGNIVVYLDWYGDYESPFEEDIPFVTFLRERLVELTAFINGSLDNFMQYKFKSYSFSVVFSFVLEEIPLLTIIGAASLFLVVVSRFIGI